MEWMPLNGYETWHIPACSNRNTNKEPSIIDHWNGNLHLYNIAFSTPNQKI